MPASPSPAPQESLAAPTEGSDDPIRKIDDWNRRAWDVRGSDTSQANALATAARDLARQHGYKLGQARATRTMAMTIVDNDSLLQIFELAEEAKVLFDEVGDADGRAGSRDFLASLYEFSGDPAAALELALDALAIAREVGDPVRQGYALSNIGGILAASGQTAAGIEHLELALGLFCDVNDVHGEGQICSRLAKVAKDAGRGDEALKYAARCRRIANKTRDSRRHSTDDWLDWSALTVMAEVSEQRGDFAAAEELYRTALTRLSAQPGRDVGGCETQISLARLLLKQGAHASAESELLDALRRLDEKPVFIVLQTAAHEALADVYEALADTTATVRHLRRAQELKERIAQNSAENKLAQVKLRDAIAAAKKDAELHKLRFVELHGSHSKRVEAEKMAILGRLAAGTAHELNTPVGVLRSNAQLTATATNRLLSLLKQHDDLGSAAAKLAGVLESCAKTSEEAMARVASIAQRYRAFAELDQAELRMFNVTDGVASALAVLEPTLPPGIQIDRRFTPVPDVNGWPRESNHAFMTVLQNAVQAIDGEGQVTVTTRTSSESVIVSIRDTGRGMSKERAGRLFDVSWSEGGTRTEMRLGLSAAYTTMQKHGGTIDVDSKERVGTTVTFRFPLPQQTAPTA